MDDIEKAVNLLTAIISLVSAVISLIAVIKVNRK